MASSPYAAGAATDCGFLGCAGGVQTFIISTEANPVVTTRAAKLKMACKQGVEDKAATMLNTCRELGIAPEQTIFVGNDINDIPAFKSTGMPVAVADAYPEEYPHVLFRRTLSNDDQCTF